MFYNLLVNYYNDKNPERQKELDFCFLENLSNETLSNIVVIANAKDYEIALSKCPENLKHKILPVITDVRPTYNHYFQLISKLFSKEDNINIISNTDIIVPKETLVYSNFYLTGKSCLALTRWDMNDSIYTNSVLFDRPDSQDTWIFKGAVPNINEADFTLGLAGCDNKIAYLLSESGYEVKNPSRTLKTYHLHLTNIRNYTNVVGQAIERIPPPYKLIHPTN